MVNKDISEDISEGSSGLKAWWNRGSTQKADETHVEFPTCEVSICWAVIMLIAALLLTGCATTVKHEVPQLDPITQAVQKIVVQDCAPQAPAPTLKMAPIGTDVVIDIQGDKVTANDGGIALLRDYVKAQRLLKP